MTLAIAKSMLLLCPPFVASYKSTTAIVPVQGEPNRHWR
jgi:hypothetical protein